jgi:hypothetical protein
MDNYTDDELDSMDEGRSTRRVKARELRLVQSADLILSGGKVARDGDEDCELRLWHGDLWASQQDLGAKEQGLDMEEKKHEESNSR